MTQEDNAHPWEIETWIEERNDEIEIATHYLNNIDRK